MNAVSPAQPLSASVRWRLAARRAGTHTLLVWPPLAVAWVVFVGIRSNALAFDLVHSYLPAAHSVLAGRSPYPSATVAALTPRTAFVYPPLAAYIAAPFTALPLWAVEVLATAVSLTCIVAALLLVGVRDWRCIMVVFLWLPAYSAIQTANVSLLIVVGLALVWRLRDRVWYVAILAGSLVALKLFLWPVLVWLIVTRRLRGAAGAVLSTVALIALSWAGIGFRGITAYPHLLSLLSRVEGRESYTIAAAVSGTMSWRAAFLTGTAVGLGILALAAHRRSDDRTSFVLTIAAMLALSPILYMHYFLALVPVLGLYRPRFSAIWTLPLLLWVAPQVDNGATWQTVAALAIVGGTFALALRNSGVQPLRAAPATA
jgi:hypothetical protein